jgi:4-hydroxy-tetrahydrodipicolinate reductase
MADMRLVVAGAGGRMGRTLVKAIADSKGFALAGALEDARSPLIGWDAGTLAGTPENGVKLSGDAGPLLAAADEAKIEDAAKSAVIVKSGNMSLGVNLLAALTRRVAATLDRSFDVEILEMHHNQKVDAPSGTALLLGRAAAEGRGIELGAHSVRARDGHTGVRKAGDIGFATLRGGSVVGEHHVIFAGQAERLELVHRAEDRMIFARGALHAAAWARGQKPGLYSMIDVLGLKDF